MYIYIDNFSQVWGSLTLAPIKHLLIVAALNRNQLVIFQAHHLSSNCCIIAIQIFTKCKDTVI